MTPINQSAFLLTKNEMPAQSEQIIFANTCKHRMPQIIKIPQWNKQIYDLLYNPY